MFKTTLLDPPWEEYGGCNRGADSHYSTMTLSEIAKVILRASWLDQSKVFQPAPSSHCWMWAVDGHLLDALSLIDQLGFRYMRTFVWVKIKDRELMNRHGAAFDPGDTLRSLIRKATQIGLGQYARSAHELLLFATRGKAMIPPPENRPPSVIFASRTEHSRKPDESYELIEKISPGPRLEIFARRSRPGWRSWGNQIEIGNSDG